MCPALLNSEMRCVSTVSLRAGAAGLAPGLAHLRTLDLSGCELDAEGLAAVVTEGAAHALETLILDENPLGEDGGAALASLLPTLPSLKRLRLRGCSLGDKGKTIQHALCRW
jgi:Ran GTPase-activating protein (RanGAP) involved in mRNA processing and transport